MDLRRWGGKGCLLGRHVEAQPGRHCTLLFRLCPPEPALCLLLSAQVSAQMLCHCENPNLSKIFPNKGMLKNAPYFKSLTK